MNVVLSNSQTHTRYSNSIITLKLSPEPDITICHLEVFGHHIAVYGANCSHLSGQSVPVLVLKCAITRGDGTTSWCNFRDEWNNIIRPNEDEIGVFLEGYTNLPYKPGTSTRTVDVANRQVAQKPQKPVETQSKLINLKYQNQMKTVFAPSSFDVMKLNALALF
ncbi:hypothetical protein BDZ97DRAFT_1838205 [Flammula alnicola]|nr:hypothetical protein BDZ97DRAFT_1838205 [Flammula alnicola]